MNKVVARFADGRIVKGTTANFIPSNEVFHLSEDGAPPGTRPVEIQKKDLKALFFVKEFAGDPKYVERSGFDPSHPSVGRRIRVKFEDGEVMEGTTTGYQAGRPGFFLMPADESSNNERCYIVTEHALEIAFI